MISDETQCELMEVIMRSKFDRYVRAEIRLRYLANFLGVAISVEITERVEVCRDPKDNKFLELAINGSADCIITGDNDLLVLNPFRGVPILQPTAFMVRYK